MRPSQEMRIVASLNTIHLIAGYSGGKEPPMHVTVRRGQPPEKPVSGLDYEPDDFVAYPDKPHQGYKVDKIVGDKVYLFFSSQKFSTWVPTHCVALQRKVKKKQH